MKIYLFLICFVIVLSGCTKTNKNVIPQKQTQINSTDSLYNKNLYLIQNTNENYISLQIPVYENYKEEYIDFIKKNLVQKLYEMSGMKFDLSLSKKDIENYILFWNTCSFFIKYNFIN